MITTVLFDLDGTLLPMELEDFAKGYFGTLAKKLVPLGYDVDTLVKGITGGITAAVKNDGTRLTKEAFWEYFSSVAGDRIFDNTDVIDEYYQKDFDGVKEYCGYNKKAAETVKYIKEKGYRTALATNPLFPAVATEKRVSWTGLSPEDFEYITNYDNSTFCKPNPMYFKEVTGKLGVTPEECLMVGNDVTEDGCAKEIGIKVFILTDNLINKYNVDINEFPHGNFDDLKEYIDSLERV